MLGRAIDQHWFERREEMPRRIGDAIVRLSAPAKFRAQFVQHRRGAGDRGAADFQPFELGEKAAARLRGQMPQVLSDLIALRHDTRVRFPARLLRALQHTGHEKAASKSDRRKRTGKFSPRATTDRIARGRSPPWNDRDLDVRSGGSMMIPLSTRF